MLRACSPPMANDATERATTVAIHQAVCNLCELSASESDLGETLRALAEVASTRVASACCQVDTTAAAFQPIAKHPEALNVLAAVGFTESKGGTCWQCEGGVPQSRFTKAAFFLAQAAAFHDAVHKLASTTQHLVALLDDTDGSALRTAAGIVQRAVQAVRRFKALQFPLPPTVEVAESVLAAATPHTAGAPAPVSAVTEAAGADAVSVEGPPDAYLPADDGFVYTAVATNNAMPNCDLHFGDDVTAAAVSGSSALNYDSSGHLHPHCTPSAPSDSYDMVEAWVGAYDEAAEAGLVTTHASGATDAPLGAGAGAYDDATKAGLVTTPASGATDAATGAGAGAYDGAADAGLVTTRASGATDAGAGNGACDGANAKPVARACRTAGDTTPGDHPPLDVPEALGAPDTPLVDGQRSEGAQSGGVRPSQLEAAPSTTAQRPGDASQHKWCMEYFRQLRHIGLHVADGTAHHAALSKLSRNFAKQAVQTGRQIIAELSLPAAAKSIKPLTTGGVAGGLKYMHDGRRLHCAYVAGSP